MMVFLEDVLSSAHVKAFVSTLSSETLFEPGARTAGRMAKAQKQNLQALNDRPETRRIVDQVRTDLKRNAAFQRFAMPAKLGRVMVSRYEPGMQYGRHYDDAFIDGARTDLSFTLFLSAPETYEGGEIELVTPAGSQAVKLPAGCALVYPSDHLHAVLPVTQGVRLAVVGWVQSRVRRADERQILETLAHAADAIEQERTDEALQRLKLARNNLMRMWAE